MDQSSLVMEKKVHVNQFWWSRKFLMGCGSGSEVMWFKRLLPSVLRILMRHRLVSLWGFPKKEGEEHYRFRLPRMTTWHTWGNNVSCLSCFGTYQVLVLLSEMKRNDEKSMEKMWVCYGNYGSRKNNLLWWTLDGGKIKT